MKGRRLHSKAPFGHWKTQTFIAGLRCHGLTAPFVVDAPMNRDLFETYVETQLAPTLATGDVVVIHWHPAYQSLTTHDPRVTMRVQNVAPKSLKMLGAPGEIRTPDPQIRSLVLYPAELRARLPASAEKAPT